MRPRRSQAKIDIKIGPRTTPLGVTYIDGEIPGQWRRRLNEETFAPFFESFPPLISLNRFSEEDMHIGHRWNLSCTGCSSYIGTSVCFLSRQTSEQDHRNASGKS